MHVLLFSFYLINDLYIYISIVYITQQFTVVCLPLRHYFCVCVCVSLATFFCIYFSPQLVKLDEHPHSLL